MQKNPGISDRNIDFFDIVIYDLDTVELGREFALVSKSAAGICGLSFSLYGGCGSAVERGSESGGRNDLEQGQKGHGAVFGDSDCF